MKISDILPPFRHRLWSIAKQGGATHAVSRLPIGVDGKISWEYMDLLHLKESYKNFGLELEVIEPGLDGQMHDMKLGTNDRDTDIEHCKQLIRNMGILGIPVFCYNFMAKFNWIRTSTTTPSRGGALVTSYDHALMEHAPLTDAGIVTADTLWDNIKYFLEAVIPVAEEYRVKLALHPDDPPVGSIQGISRIITSAEAMQKVLDLVPSAYSGITLCQGTLAAAGEDIPAVIRDFGSKGKIFFVHFRDIRGTAECFTETFHDDGQTNMLETIKAYKEIGYTGPVRIDHAPTLEGEENAEPGYAEMGRLYALGYLKGLLENANH